VAAYLEVEEGSFEPTVDYDLANVYAQLGEYSAATELYERARHAGNVDLRADSFFNEGVASYEKGRYEEAWRSFKEALGLYLATPAALPEGFASDARRNLELSWRSWKKRSLAPPDSVAPSGRVGGGMDETELRLLRRLETGRWRPGSKLPPVDARGDY
jgi:tetratricopeptide (TPR) repeat protein